MASIAGGMHPTGMHICYRQQMKFGKVMFLHLSVSHSVHRGRGVSQHAMGQHYISSYTGVESQLVWGQHTGNIKCMMG